MGLDTRVAWLEEDDVGRGGEVCAVARAVVSADSSDGFSTREACPGEEKAVCAGPSGMVVVCECTSGIES
jgi:hypothetical protein